MTMSDLTLLRAVLRYARAHGVKHHPDGLGRSDPDGNWSVGYRPLGRRRHVTTEPDVTIYRRDPYRVTTLPKATVRETVDVLVDFGILPATFHSAYAVAAAERAAAIEGVRARLAEHYLAQVVCDNERGMDNPICSCSMVHLGWHPSVGAAVAAWIDHVLAAPGGEQRWEYGYYDADDNRMRAYDGTPRVITAKMLRRPVMSIGQWQTIPAGVVAGGGGPDYEALTAEWHDAPAGSPAAGKQLHEFLGMTWEEYQRWAGPAAGVQNAAAPADLAPRQWPRLDSGPGPDVLAVRTASGNLFRPVDPEGYYWTGPGWNEVDWKTLLGWGPLTDATAEVKASGGQLAEVEGEL